MQLFKAYYKVLSKNFGQFLVYIVVFVTLAVLMATMGPVQKMENFTEERVKAAVIDRDGSEVSRRLADQMGKICELVSLPDDKERLQDELFYRNVEYIAIIPAGFGEQFLKGEGKLDSIKPSDSATAFYAERQVNSFLATVSQYLNAGYSQAQAFDNAAKDSGASTNVTLMQSKEQSGTDYAFVSFFRFLSYIVLALLILGISMIVMVFYNPDLYRRNCCSPLSQRKQSGQLLLAGTLFSIVCWAGLSLFSLCFYGGSLIRSPAWWLAVLNTFVFTIVSASVGFSVGVFCKTANIQSAAANVICLASSFLTGAFVPQEMLSEKVLAVGAFLPNYWYIKLNDMLPTMSRFTFGDLAPAWKCLGIQLAFAAAIASAALLFSKERFRFSLTRLRPAAK